MRPALDAQQKRVVTLGERKEKKMKRVCIPFVIAVGLTVAVFAFSTTCGAQELKP